MLYTDTENYILLEPQWSPTADLIAFKTLSRNSFPNYDLWVMDSNGDDPHALVTAPKSFGGPRWSPDGQHLALQPARSEPELILIVDRDGTNDTPVPGLTQDSDTGFDDW